ncbi:[protein-PII] uridylyltransferase [Swaminathania salitolerans]|uniref:Bifunctional uridylyltransferase/uridylyl-removing enzyme n=1 Tax=Swaminathania salitolerans TaxID=182838 RepID=A0A511BPC2_9PROT|nr:[protein-PII] uridylyltransferase [Swaminathania salitolerans]GBQ15812.1 uridylyltransferase PII [Swaminathania salitolerans LMG 21291]GEL01494.1 bifunctional uridylyltransferase/uridylyl-removing enzyme [Swaminathania salitolerans]
MHAVLSAALDRVRLPDGTVAREDAVSIFRRHIGRHHGEIRRLFEGRQLKGIAAAATLARLMDGAISSLFALARATTGAAESGLCVCATGGYGGGLLAPYSDIDLLFLTDEPLTPDTTAQVEYMLYFLWDLGVRVGHATRSIAGCIEAAREDITIRTTLLDARRIAGSEPLFARFGAHFSAGAENALSFIHDKIDEREQRHRRFGDNPYMVEPNIKEGRGGLRDLQTLNWMTRIVQDRDELNPAIRTRGNDPVFATLGLLTEQEGNRARRAWNFLWTIRLHLHYIAGRADERLAFDVQPVIGGRMGYAGHGRQQGVERFMRHYFLTTREVMRLGRILEPGIMQRLQGPAREAPYEGQGCDTQEARHFRLINGEIAPAERACFDNDPRLMVLMLRAACRDGLTLHPTAIQQLIRNERRVASLRDDPLTMQVFLELLMQPTRMNRQDSRPSGADWLTILNDTGFLGALLPDWSRIVGQMQFDTYHIYTVDEHNIEAVRMLGRIEAGAMADEIPLVYDLTRDMQSRRAMYVATLLHDVAKGRGGDHSVLGAEVAQHVCPQLGLDAEETETVSWLILHHLLLSQTAFRRDIDDPRTILDLADIIQSPERLRLLLILTIADMRAVSPNVWNAWKATLLRELYTRVAEVLEGGLAATERDERVSHAKELVRDGLLQQGLASAQAEHFLTLGYAGYWLGFDADTHLRHARLVLDSETHEAPLTIETTPIPQRDVTEITILSADHSGLFSQIAGGLAVAGASIVDARIHTLSDGMALDTFWVQDAHGRAFETPLQLSRLNGLIEQALSSRLPIGAELDRLANQRAARRMRAIHVPSRVVIDNRASERHTIIEINGRDRPGLLYDVTRTISEQSLQISSAHITTYGMRAVDVFYVRDLVGTKVTSETRMAEIRSALLATLRDDDSSRPTEHVAA